MKKIVIGLSGGVDSSVAAYLLKKQGYEVIGVTMQIWRQEEEIARNGYEGITAVEDAKRVARELGIPHYVMDFQPAFEKNVVQYFIREYESGRTPNPCVMCNRHVKWQALYERAQELGAELIATGHYSRIVQLPNGRYALKRSATDAKDQTYALCNLTQDQLSHTRMPLGDYTKEEIRDIADGLGLTIANKPDSQEICFIPDNNYSKFLEERSQGNGSRGNFVTASGEVLGQHQGITHYTIGQRKGLGLAFGRPVFVTQIRPETREVVIGEAEDVMGSALLADSLNFMSIPDLIGEKKVTAKIRYSHRGEHATIRKVDEDTILCQFDRPVRAITPGQALVMYDGDLVLGGAIIRSKISWQSGSTTKLP